MTRPTPNQRLSQTKLWEMQARAYHLLGIEAWTQRGIPSYLSSNPFIAKRYAHVAFAYVQERVARLRIHRSEPLYLFELGAGTGRFTYIFLKYFLHLLQDSPLNRLRVRYIMTDLSPEVIAGWRAHPYFQRLFESGILDCAKLNLSHLKEMKLLSSGEEIGPGSVRNPSIVIANYLFGYLPSDLFTVREGQLHEGLVALDTQGVTAARKPQTEDLICKTRFRKLPKGDYYDITHWNAALTATAADVLETPFTVPVGAYRALDFLREVCTGGYCFLSADRGAVTPQQISELQGVNVSRNALCAVAINYRALLKYFLQKGEMACTTRQPHPTFVVMCATAGGLAEEHVMTRRAFSQLISDFEPADYWELVNRFEIKDRKMTLEEIYYILKLGDWDSTIFHSNFEIIRRHLASANLNVRALWGEALDSILDNFFPISALEANLIVNIGVLHFDLKNWHKALSCFQRAHIIAGDQAHILHNMGLCYHQLRDERTARACHVKAAKLDPRYRPSSKPAKTARRR